MADYEIDPSMPTEFDEDSAAIYAAETGLTAEQIVAEAQPAFGLGGFNRLSNSTLENIDVSNNIIGWEASADTTLISSTAVVAQYGTKVARLTKTSAGTGNIGLITSASGRVSTEEGVEWVGSAYYRYVSGATGRDVYLKLLFYDANNISIPGITGGTLPVAPPTGITAAVDTTPGVLPAGTYYYKVIASLAGGDTIASNEVSVTLSGTNSALINWNILPGAHNYMVFRGTASGLQDTMLGARQNLSLVDTGELLDVTSNEEPDLTKADHWYRIAVTGLAPPNTKSIGFEYVVNNATFGELHYADSFQLEHGKLPTTFSPRADEILPKTVTPTELSVSSLSAITVDAGLITAGTFRGPIFETSESNPKVRHDSTGFFVTDAAGNKPVKLVGGSGLDFMSSSNFVTPERGVRWMRGTAVIGEILGVSQTSGVQQFDETRLYARAYDATRYAAQTDISAADEQGYFRSQLSARYFPSGSAITGVESVEAFTSNSGTRIIINSSEWSDFLQLVSTQKLKMAHGSAIINVPVNAAIHSIPINHGLGVVPVQVLITTQHAAYFPAWIGGTTTKFDAYVTHYQNTLSTTVVGVPISWIAFG